MYEDKCAGKLPEAIFNSLMSGYIDEQAELSEKKSALNETLTKYKDADRDIKKWLDLVEQYKDITELTRAIVYLLIDHIEVGQAPSGNDDIQEITIHYRFIGNLLNPTQKAVCKLMFMKNICEKRKGTLGKTENAFNSVNTMPIRPKIRCVLPKLPKMNITNDPY